MIGVTSALARADAGFSVTSSLDRLLVLPHRIQWRGYTTLPASKVSEVDFFIDGGANRWTEHKPPYSFSSDTGYLVTSWLKPGIHRFTVKAVAKDGRVAADTVKARVGAPPPVPAELRGVWQRTLGPTHTPGWPRGTYKLIFDPRWISLIHPGPFDPVKSIPTGEGYINYFDWDPGTSSLHTQGVVTLKEQGPKDRVRRLAVPAGRPGCRLHVVGARVDADPEAGRRAGRLRTARSRLGRRVGQGGLSRIGQEEGGAAFAAPLRFEFDAKTFRLALGGWPCERACRRGSRLLTRSCNGFL